MTTITEGEGYVYVVYGGMKYLHHAVASLLTLRRYDTTRKAALVCQPQHRAELEKRGLSGIFDHYHPLAEGHDSIVGFKHNVDQYLIFEKNLFLDSDIVWCKDPGPLWKQFSAYGYTITGNIKADYFFGAPKGPGIIRDFLFKRRERTLKRFGLTYLSRVQSGMIYAADRETTAQVCKLAGVFLDRIDETHFQSRKKESGRSLESCEWSLAMAMSDLNIPVFPWLQGHDSPQLDYIGDIVSHDEDFDEVACTFHTHPFVYSLRGIKPDRIRRAMYSIFTKFPGWGDYQVIKPYAIHFGWLHQKDPFYDFAERQWEFLKTEIIRFPEREQHSVPANN